MIKSEGINSENEMLDFKLQFHFTEKKDKLELVKDIVSLANTYGGMIVYGVRDEDKEWIGLDESSDDLNDIQIRDFLRNYVNEHIDFEIASYVLDNETFYFLTVDKYEGDIIQFASDGSYERKKKNVTNGINSFVFKKNEEYGRIGSSCRPINNDSTFKLRRKNSGRLITNLSNYERPYKTYVNRPNELEKLLFSLNNPNVRNVQINGLGGIGKTSFIRNFCDRVECGNIKLNQNINFLIWITGKMDKFTPSGIIEQIRYNEIDFSEMIEIISDVMMLNKIDKNDEELESEILDKIKTYNTLFIFDNMETISDKKILDFIKKVPLNTRIIFTTRGNLTTVYERIDLDGFEMKQFVEYIENTIKDYNSKDNNCDLNQYYKDLHELVLGSPIITNMIIYKYCNGFSIDSIIKSLRSMKKDKSYYDEVMKFCFDETINKMSILEKQLLFVMSLSDDKDELFQISDFKFILETDEMDINDAISKIFTVSFCFMKGDKYACSSLVKAFANKKLSKDVTINQRNLTGKYYEWNDKKKEFTFKEESVFARARAYDFEKKEIVIYIREMLYKYLDSEDYELIMDEFDKLINTYPTYSYIYFKKANFEKTIGYRSTEVKKCYEQAIFNDPNNDYYLSEYAFYLSELRENDKAISLFEKALSINSQNPSINHGLALAYKNYYYGKQEYVEFSSKICELFSKGYFSDNSRYSNNHNVRNAHAFAGYLYSIGRYDDALIECKKGFEYSTNSSALKSMYSTIMQKINPDYVSRSKLEKMKKGLFVGADDDFLKGLHNMSKNKEE